MTLIGWIIFGVVCLGLVCALLFTKHMLKPIPFVVAIVLAAGVGVGAFFAARAIFAEKKEEPAVVEVVEEEPTPEVPTNAPEA